MKEKIILIGGGGHCKSVIDVIEQEGKFEIAGIVDVKEKIGTEVLGYKIIASDNELSSLINTYTNYHICVGFIKPSKLRVNLFQKLKSIGATLPVIVSPKSTVSAHSKIGEGSIIMHNAFVNAGVTIGENCIINTGATIEHDTSIGDNCHISTGAVVNGDCTIMENCFIGSNSVIINNINIPANCIIGAGAVILKNLNDEFTTAVGNPAVALKK